MFKIKATFQLAYSDNEEVSVPRNQWITAMIFLTLKLNSSTILIFHLQNRIQPATTIQPHILLRINYAANEQKTNKNRGQFYRTCKNGLKRRSDNKQTAETSKMHTRRWRHTTVVSSNTSAIITIRASCTKQKHYEVDTHNAVCCVDGRWRQVTVSAAATEDNQDSFRRDKTAGCVLDARRSVERWLD